jgi:DNA-nicking Smr family endonuclease
MIRRGLSPEERALWAKVRRTVRPLDGGRAPDADERQDRVGDPLASEPPVERQPPVQASARPPRRPAAISTPPAPPLAPLEPKARRRLARGAAEPEARLDLHGMRQASAFHALAAFLRQAQARGARTVLVITGKGREADSESGVLRQVVPKWLAEPQFRQLVVGFEGAARRHGGEGAFYVRLRRRRPKGS